MVNLDRITSQVSSSVNFNPSLAMAFWKNSWAIKREAMILSSEMKDGKSSNCVRVGVQNL
jgi:hypothetical protein